MNRALSFILFLSFVVSGCAGPGRTEGPGPASVPVSEQTASGVIEKSAKTHTELGILYLQSGNLAVAMEEARLAVLIDPAYAPGHDLMGLVHMVLNEIPQAKVSFERAIQLAPGDPVIANDYGWFLCQNGQAKESFKYFEAAYRNPLYKTPTRPLTNAGLCYLQIKEDKQAEDNFRRALMVDGSNVQAMFHLSSLAYKRGDFYNAKNILGELHRLSDPNAESLWLGLRIERKLGDRPAEASYAAQLRRKFSGTPEYQALQQGNFE